MFSEKGFIIFVAIFAATFCLVALVFLMRRLWKLRVYPDDFQMRFGFAPELLREAQYQERLEKELASVARAVGLAAIWQERLDENPAFSEEDRTSAEITIAALKELYWDTMSNLPNKVWWEETMKDLSYRPDPQKSWTNYSPYTEWKQKRDALREHKS